MYEEICYRGHEWVCAECGRTVQRDGSEPRYIEVTLCDKCDREVRERNEHRMAGYRSWNNELQRD